MSKAGIGTAAALGSFAGLVIGAIAGNMLAKTEQDSRGKVTTAALSVALGSAIGAFAGAALATPTTTAAPAHTTNIVVPPVSSPPATPVSGS